MRLEPACANNTSPTPWASAAAPCAKQSAPTGAVFGKGKDRGDLLELRADYRFSPAFKGHILYEHLAPGSFYAGQSSGHFLRFELSWLFTARF